MINWLVLILVLINLGVFAWGMSREQQRSEPAPEVHSGIPRLVLVEEQQAAQAEATSTSSDPALAETLDSSETQTAAADEAVRVPTAKSLLPGEGVGSETEARRTAAPVPEEADVEAVIPTLAPPIHCYTLGPFPKRDDAEVVIDLLRPSARAADIRREVDEQQIGYWVVIPPLENESAAIAKVRELKAAGITDVWRFNRGRLANAISLGLFARESLARAHSEDISRKGFTAEVRPRIGEKSTYWIDARFGEVQDIGDGVWLRITEDFPDTQSTAAKCEL